MHVLVIEDDTEVSAYIAKQLSAHNHSCDQVADGKEGLAKASAGSYDALVVDRMLPGMDGLKIVQTLRSTGHTTPVIFLTALGDVSNRVEGLKNGGDDYLVKPFAFSELLARLELLVAKANPTEAAPTRFTARNVVLDLLSRNVTLDGVTVPLQNREFRLLEYLMRYKNQVVTRDMLLEHVWDYAFDPQTNIIDVHISRLRQKLDADSSRPLIRTVRGAGYMIEE